MMVGGEVILRTLELIADRHGDPTAAIYQRLFAAHRELQALFVMDRDGGVRASMVQQAFECIIDYVGPRLVAPRIIASSRIHHDGYGVPAERFDDFFVAMRDTFRDLLGRDWSPEMEEAWAELLREFATIR
ncbi:MAG: globin [Burkholderiales bacterium]|nr:MAG: globin [Burkholderiales bacterium]